MKSRKEPDMERTKKASCQNVKDMPAGTQKKERSDKGPDIGQRQERALKDEARVLAL